MAKKQAVGIEGITARASPILRRHNVIRAALFGSIVRGEMKKTSDVDVLVEIRGQKSLLDVVALRQELEDAVGRKVDLVQYSAIHPMLRERILKEQKVII